MSRGSDFSRALGLWAAMTDRALGKIVGECAAEVEARVAQRTPVDTGRARAAWRTEVDGDGQRAVVFNDVAYIRALENGHSKQAPVGMVKVTVNEWPQIVAKVVRHGR